jgi:hypothetical protein
MEERVRPLDGTTLLRPVAGILIGRAFPGHWQSSLSIGYTFGLIIIFVCGHSTRFCGRGYVVNRTCGRTFRGLVVWIAANHFCACRDEDLGDGIVYDS